VSEGREGPTPLEGEEGKGSPSAARTEDRRKCLEEGPDFSARMSQEMTGTNRETVRKTLVEDLRKIKRKHTQ
jgi:hypothetical protein